MPGKYFVDTNVLLYRYANQDEHKSRIAARLLKSGECIISIQVINEFCNVVRRKFSDQFAQIEIAVQEIRANLPIEQLQLADSISAVGIAQRHQLKFYDALILACAKRLHCQAVLSEDMQHGFVLDGQMTIVNPFVLGGNDAA